VISARLQASRADAAPCNLIRQALNLKRFDDSLAIDRRSFVKASLIPVFIPATATLAGLPGQDAQPTTAAPEIPEIIDTNVHLFDWPFRKLKYARTQSLVAKLRKHRITKAWAGSFEAVLHKQLDRVNRRLEEECRTRGEGVFMAIGSVNPARADWEEDLRRCHEQYRMRGVRLYPAYHGYALDHREFARLIAEAAKRDLIVQIVLRMEDERVHHAAINIGAVDVSPLPDLLGKVAKAKVQLINSAGPLLGKNVARLVRETKVVFDIAATEGNGGVGQLIEGQNYSYKGAIPIERLLFGSHAPYFPCESALLKLFESPLSLAQLQLLMRENAQRLLG
jgi:predicted TIM-barrel fold metal-dependent hydrolase